MIVSTTIVTRYDLYPILWGQGKRNFRALTKIIPYEVHDKLRDYLDDRFPEDINIADVAVNDFLSYDTDTYLRDLSISEDDFCKALEEED